MGTTLGLNGAYDLAGALVRHPDNYDAAFAEYEEKMRPLVDEAQAKPPRIVHLLALETAWGIWMLRTFVFILSCSGLPRLMAMFSGTPDNAVPIEDYGFKQLPEWTVEEERNST